MNKSELDRIKAFGMTNNMIMDDLSQISKEFSVDLGHISQSEKRVKDIYYPQFKSEIRFEASKMSLYYELFYCLERSIRDIVSQVLEETENNTEWWQTSRISAAIKQEVAQRIQKELDSGTSRRSNEELDYTTFGELSQIITTNWDVFGSMFSSKKAVEKVMSSLNTIRGPIAHCSLLAEDEILRLNLTIRDWFRLME